MKKIKSLGIILLSILVLASCAKREAQEISGEVIEVSENDLLAYLSVEGAVASSFDDTPDWAPLPDAMAAVDRDMLTRWSPKLGVDNQWIYFDFGKEKVLDKIIIKWERAYASEYEILTSKDAKSWRRLVLKKDGKGGTEELKFPAVRARYVKLIGLKRNNPKWGFSIWEFELYGPQSLNPGEEVVVEGEEDLEKEKRELKEALAEAKTPLSKMTLDEIQKGVCYTSWMYDELSAIVSDKMLLHLKSIGTTHIAIVVPAYQEEIDSDVIFMNDFEGGDTRSDESIEHAIKVAHDLGIKVLLKPHVDCRDETPRVDIIASEKWFDSYEKMILRYAKLAERNKVEIFSVGTELEGTTFSRWEARWRDVINKIKSVYSGYLIYSANWTEYKSVPFWDMLDFIGIDAYFPLTENLDPTKEELIASWELIAENMEIWLNEKGLEKSIVFTEVGYPSSDGASKQPWVQMTEVEDQPEQRDCLEAVFVVMLKKPFFKGLYLWQYLPQDRWSPLGFTVKDKQAEEVLSKWFKNVK